MSVRRVQEIWGTVASVEVREQLDEHTFDQVFRCFERVDELFSTWRDDSEVMRIGRGELALDDASPEVREVLGQCVALRAETDGAFDIAAAAGLTYCRPGQAPIDPSGFVKGWALEEAATMLGLAGAHAYCIEAGGDVLVRGGGWRVGIRHPRVPRAVCAIVEVSAGGVATSGCYERGAHILDPRALGPASGLLCATVIGEDLGVADAWATALMVLGVDGLDGLGAARPGYDAMVVTEDREVVMTVGFEARRATS